MNPTRIPNNKYLNCPAQMADGRQFTDYRPISKVNQDVMHEKNIQSNFDFRNYLIHNGNDMIDSDRTVVKEKNDCNECNAMYIKNKYACKTNYVGQMCEPFDINGIGRTSISVGARKVPTIKELNKTMNEFNMFLETNMIETAARPGIMCDSCKVKQ
tara:strand:+ start:349 stop:819 length:471 start_codon:yes stop_codon:yes gene_type:complete